MSRSYVNPQAGRNSRAHAGADNEEWGTTSSQAQFKGYEPAEMRSCRSQPTQVRPAFEPLLAATGGGGSSASASRNKTQRSFGHTPFQPLSALQNGSQASAVTLQSLQGSSASRARRGGNPGDKYDALPGDQASCVTYNSSAVTCPSSQAEAPRAPAPPAHSVPSRPQPPAAIQAAANRPIPERPFLRTKSTAHEDQDTALEHRKVHFPYRDEFAPRSKRLLYEMALAKCSRDSVASASTANSVGSCRTISSNRSSSCPSIAQSQGSRLLTADSRRVVGGICKRRMEANLKAPMQWGADAEWIHTKAANEGPAGLTPGQYKPSYYNNSIRAKGDQLFTFGPCLNGVKEDD